MESVVAFTFPLASIVIVLFLLWNDLLRRRRTLRAILFARALLCVALAAVLIFNWVTFRSRLEDLPILFVLLAALVSVLAAVWFFYRGIRGDRGFVAPDEEPLPKIFDVNRKEKDQPRRDPDE